MSFPVFGPRVDTVEDLVVALRSGQMTAGTANGTAQAGIIMVMGYIRNYPDTRERSLKHIVERGKAQTKSNNSIVACSRQNITIK